MKLIKISLLFLTALLIVLGYSSFSRMMSDRSKGTVFTIKLEAYSGDKTGLAERAVKVIRNRLDSVGLDGEASVDKDSTGQILVKIYGSPAMEKAKKFLFVTNQLELKEVISEATPRAVQVFSSRAEAQKIMNEQREILTYWDAKNQMELLVVVKKEPIVSGENIRDAQAVWGNDDDNYHISFSLRPDGAIKFGDWTGKNIGLYLAIVLDRKVQSMPYIKSQIFDSGQIDGKFTKEEAENIALSLRSGYLPATMKIVKEETFGN